MGGAMGRNQRRGADAERAVARRMGGTRSGNTGRAVADVVGDGFVVECKERASLPQWQLRALTQAERAAAGFTSPVRALVRLHILGTPYAEDIIMQRAGEYECWHGRLAGYRGGDDPAA